MPFDRKIIYDDQIVKIESSSSIIKRTSFFDKSFSFIHKTDLLLNLMQDYEDITIDQATTDPILNSLLFRSDIQTTKSKVAILLGKYAEALMVMNCNGNDSFNRHLAENHLMTFLIILLLLVQVLQKPKRIIGCITNIVNLKEILFG